ncbi:hypothetical protein CAPTEDRAFT_97513 [Capitella teleta]|uniref:G-protein coupled receptors family 1 profile domain-containing protein n=1 Tax=Capitella teleta TaxID=283909 RepID=R7VCZ7_CAPTE|nr:hypothetical protein CAPTEDRAFT_97513 [Capitella teleta]|eukprot:ELU16683.1 hypothetical protein CAPTEDRAFT_97513 [Capitella teleta]
MTTELPADSTALAAEITDPKHEINYLYMILLIPVIVVTFTANFVVVLCIYCYRPLQRPNNYYVASLAVADGVVGFLVMSGMLLVNIYGDWPLSDALCTAWIGLDFSCCTISMLHLCLIAQDRHCALTKPHEYRSRDRSKRITVMIALAWVLGLVAWIPAVIFFRANTSPGADNCLFLPDKLYVICQSCVIYGVPVVVMLYLYTQCVKGLRAHFMKIASIREEHMLATRSRTQVMVVASFSTIETSTAPQTGEPSTGRSRDVLGNKNRGQSREHERSVRTLGMVIGVFIFCWLPFCVMWPVQSFCDNCAPIGMLKYSYWAAYLNSTVNPLLYFASNRDFRLAFKSLVGMTTPKV